MPSLYGNLGKIFTFIVCNYIANPYVFIMHSSIYIMSLIEETLELIKTGDRLFEVFSPTQF